MINGLFRLWRSIICNNRQRIIKIAGKIVRNQPTSNESRVTELVSIDRKLNKHGINPTHHSQNIPVITGHRPANRVLPRNHSADLNKIPTERRGKNQHQEPCLFYTNCRSLNHDKLNDLAVHIQERLYAWPRHGWQSPTNTLPLSMTTITFGPIEQIELAAECVCMWRTICHLNSYCRCQHWHSQSLDPDPNCSQPKDHLLLCLPSTRIAQR